MLHIGSGYMVPGDQVVMICDLGSVDARAYLSRMKKGPHLVRIDDEARSLIVCCGKWNETAYLSPISARTLMQRFEARQPGMRRG